MGFRAEWRAQGRAMMVCSRACEFRSRGGQTLVGVSAPARVDLMIYLFTARRKGQGRLRSQLGVGNARRRTRRSSSENLDRSGQR